MGGLLGILPQNLQLLTLGKALRSPRKMWENIGRREEGIGSKQKGGIEEKVEKVGN